MKIGVVGSGGREHALVLKLAQAKTVKHIYCAPGSDAIGDMTLASSGERVQCLPFGATDAKQIADFARDNKIDLVVPGPESCLEAGLGDFCRAYRIPFAGPDRRGARLETSKSFAFQFMRDHFVSCPAGEICETITVADARWRSFAKDGDEVVFKADGPSLGKGVLLPPSHECYDLAVRNLMTGKDCGSAGYRILIQKREIGDEVSVHLISDSRQTFILPYVRDYKRERKGNTGLNTGGMGAYSPVPSLSDGLALPEFCEYLVSKLRVGCWEEEIEYRGILYPGLILTHEGPKVLEFNCRWGDPEAQVLLDRFEGDLAELLFASATDGLKPQMLQWSPLYSVCVVLASRGYPGKPEIGKEINGLEEAVKLGGIDIIHAGTRREDKKWFTNGGRVLGVRAKAPTLQGARLRAYDAIKRIHFDGMWCRPDIADEDKGVTIYLE